VREVIGMSDSNDDFDMSFRNFDQFFGGKMPFMPSGGSTEPMGWVENYVKDVLKQSMPKTAFISGNDKAPVHTEMFETHNSIIVKMHIPDKAQAKSINVMVSEHQIRLENIPPKKSKQTIRLNSFVLPSSCKAVYKAGVLQLHMRKQEKSDYYHKVNVRFT
jgi:HSP20 family molecular chaperone IbpA